MLKLVTTLVALSTCIITHAIASPTGGLTAASVELINGTGIPLSLALRSTIRRSTTWSRYMPFSTGKSMWFTRSSCEISLLVQFPNGSQARYGMGVIDFAQIAQIDPKARIFVRTHHVQGTALPHFHVQIYSRGGWYHLPQFLAQSQDKKLEPQVVKGIIDALRGLGK